MPDTILGSRHTSVLLIPWSLHSSFGETTVGKNNKENKCRSLLGQIVICLMEKSQERKKIGNDSRGCWERPH